MVREIIHDPVFLRRKSLNATSADLPIAEDLVDTLRANAERCVGLAANMIGKRKRIIAFCNGPLIMVMLNPKIINRDGEYETEEGCLSLTGVRKTKRYRIPPGMSLSLISLPRVSMRKASSLQV